MNCQITLRAPLAANLAGDFLAKLSYASEALDAFAFTDDSRSAVAFSLRPGKEGMEGEIATRIVEIADKMGRSFRDFKEKVLGSTLDLPVGYSDDPHPELEASGALVRYGSGRYGLGSLPVALLEYFDGQVQALAERIGAAKRQYPALIGADTLEQCRYLRSFPHSLNLVSHLREDLAAIQNFAREAAWQGTHLQCSASDLAAPKVLLSPSVCFHHYAWLANSELPEGACVTALGKCFRWESGNLKGLERLWDFTMREIIFVGSKDYVLTFRQRMVEDCRALLDAWGLAYEISSAMDPFFIEDFAQQTAFQRAFDLKFEIKARLPYRSDKPLAIGSFNYHQEFFGKSFNINAAGAPAHTGCVGFGLERVVLAFLAQHGLERSNWPSGVRQALA